METLRLELSDARLLLGHAAILPVAQAVRMLPIGNAAARAWLKSRGLIRDLEGVPVVIWGDVVATLKGDPPTEEAPRPTGISLRRSPL